jgi:hypothetical protein
LAEKVFARHNENILDQIKKDMELVARSKKESRQLRESQSSQGLDQG